MALIDQIFDQRIFRGEIENVIFHDPSRSDQHRLGIDLFCGRCILDQLNEAVLINHLALGHSYIFTDLIVFHPGSLLAGYLLHPIIHEILSAPEKIKPALFGGGFDNMRIGQREIER